MATRDVHVLPLGESKYWRKGTNKARNTPRAQNNMSFAMTIGVYTRTQQQGTWAQVLLKIGFNCKWQ